MKVYLKQILVIINYRCFFIVTLSSDNPNVTFRGFIIQARTQPENNLVGSFIIVDEQTRLRECQLSGEDPVSISVRFLQVVLHIPELGILNFAVELFYLLVSD